MTAAVLRADARSLPLPDASVDLLVTSPPYFGLRSYTDGGEHYGGQIGSEATPREWLAAMLDCTREWVRVLKPSGSIFVNLGDKFSQRTATRPSSHQDGLFPDRPELQKDWKRDRAAGLARMPYENVIDGDGNYVREKSLMGLPWRYALACMDDLGLILRRDIIWSKPNGLPESVTDRCRSSHEYVFHLVKQPRYYAAVDEIREEHTGTTHPQNRSADQKWLPAALTRGSRSDGTSLNPLGKLPGSVWDIPSQPLTVPAHLDVQHFAAFPMELPRRIILGWSPSGICTACGEGRRPVTERDPIDPRHLASNARQDSKPRLEMRGVSPSSILRAGLQSGQSPATTITGYACACPEPTAPTRPAVVADPFGGTGTAALVASMYGRLGLSFDLSADYCRLARWRTRDPAQRAAAMGVPKPPPVPDGQGDLFDMLEVAP